MKILIFILVFFSINVNASQCIDHSGSYSLSSELSEQVDLKIDQFNCEKITLEYYREKKLDRTESFLLNNQKVKIGEYSDLGLTLFATPYVKWPDIVIDMEQHWNDGTIDKYKRRFHLSYNLGSGELYDERGKFRIDGVFVPDSQLRYYKNK